MPKAPDWLLRDVNDAPHLIEDSPQFRKLENQRNEKNMRSAIDMAMEQIRIETEDQQRKAAQASILEMQKMSPVPSAMEGTTKFFDDEGDDGMQPLPEDSGSRYIPGPQDFDTPPMAAAGTEQEANPGMPSYDEDPVATVQIIAQTLGITPQQVAALSMLGEDIRRNYTPEEQTPPQGPMAQPATGNPEMPMPLSGPSGPPPGPVPPPMPPPMAPGAPNPANPAMPPPGPAPMPLAGPPPVV